MLPSVGHGLVIKEVGLLSPLAFLICLSLSLPMGRIFSRGSEAFETSAQKVHH